MAERDDDSNSNRGFASMDKETRERIARKGGEASHRNDDTRSSSSSSGRSEPSGSERGGSSRGSSDDDRGRSAGGRAGEGEGARYDPGAGQCRDDSGRFVECPDDEKGTARDPNKERVASKGGEHSRGGHGGSSGSSSSASSSGGRSRRD